jgi:hypothetical protein
LNTNRTGGLSCYPVNKVCRLVVASAVLHNIYIERRIPLLPEDEHFREAQFPVDAEEQNPFRGRQFQTGANTRARIVEEYF